MNNPEGEIDLREILGEEIVDELEAKTSDQFGHIKVIEKFESYKEEQLGKAFYAGIRADFPDTPSDVPGEHQAVQTHIAHAFSLDSSQMSHVFMMADGSVFITGPSSPAMIKEYKRHMRDNVNPFVFNGIADSVRNVTDYIRAGNITWMEVTPLGVMGDVSNTGGGQNQVEETIKTGYQIALQDKLAREQAKKIGRRTIVNFQDPGQQAA